jgi:hypothetical protein
LAFFLTRIKVPDYDAWKPNSTQMTPVPVNQDASVSST